MIFGPVGATSFTISSITVTRTDSDIAEFKKVCRLLEPFCVHTISTTCPRYDPNSPSFFASEDSIFPAALFFPPRSLW